MQGWLARHVKKRHACLSHSPTARRPCRTFGRSHAAHERRGEHTLRTPAMSLVTPVVVSLCTTHTALIFFSVSFLSSSSRRPSSAPVPHSHSSTVTCARAPNQAPLSWTACMHAWIPMQGNTVICARPPLQALLTWTACMHAWIPLQLHASMPLALYGISLLLHGNASSNGWLCKRVGMHASPTPAQGLEIGSHPRAACTGQTSMHAKATIGTVSREQSGEEGVRGGARRGPCAASCRPTGG